MVWKPGQSGNPRGRPPKNRELVDTIKAKIEEGDNNKVVNKLWGIIESSSDEKAVIEAGKLLMAYGYGKPVQRKELSGPGGGAIMLTAARKEIAELSDADLEAELELVQPKQLTSGEKEIDLLGEEDPNSE